MMNTITQSIVKRLALPLMGVAFVFVSLLMVGVNQANAQELLLTCIAETSRVGGYFISDTAACSVPNDVTITRANLEVVLDDGGDIYINNSNAYSQPNTVGVKYDSRDIDSGLRGGENFSLRVEARNAIDDAGGAVGELYGKATLRLWGNRGGGGGGEEIPPAACQAPVNVSPSNTVKVSSNSSYATLSWNPVPGAVSYNVRLEDGTSERYDDPRFQTCSGSNHYYCENGITGNSISNVPVKVGRTYNLWVDPVYSPARNYCNGGSTFSVEAEYVPQVLGCPAISSPSDGALLEANANPRFSWNSASGRDTYIIDITTDPTFSWWWNNGSGAGGGSSQLSAYFSSATNDYYSQNNQPHGTTRAGATYYWRVYGYQASTNLGCHSPIRSFSIRAPQGVTADIKANGQDGSVTINYGGSAAISWTSSGASQCTVSPSSWSGTSGSRNVSNMQNTQTYSVVCTGQGGTATDEVTVNVNPAAEVSADIKANGQDGPVTVPFGSNVTISWSSQNATSCSISPSGWSGISGSRNVTISDSRTYTITCTGQGGTDTDNVTVIPQAGSLTADIKANGQDGSITLPYNSNPNISWTSQNADSCTVSPSGWTGVSGSRSAGNLTTSRTYTVNCTGQGGTASDSVTVNIGVQEITADIKANGQDGSITIQNGTSANISWTSENATSCSVSPGGWTGTTGSRSTGNLSASQTYVLSCTGPAGSATDSVTVNVGVGQISADIRANGQDGSVTIGSGNSATITWNSNNATSCTVSPSGWTGTTGSRSTGNLYNTQTYNLTCTGPAGSATDSVTVNVTAGEISADIRANGQNGPITINSGSSATISWTSQNATYCSVSPSGWTGLNDSQQTGNLSASQTYVLNCTGPAGSATDSVTVNINQLSPSVQLNANPRYINQGQNSTLTWTSQNANSCQVSGGWTGTRSINGSESVSPSYTTTYTIVCTNSSGQTATDTETITVSTVQNQPTLTLNANPVTINQGGTSVLVWNSQYTSNCQVSGGWSGSRSTNGSENVSPSQTTTYYMTCNGVGGGTVSAQATVYVNSVLPTVTLMANPSNVNPGQPVTLTWYSQNANYCFASNGWSGSKSISGSEIVYPQFNTNYVITCTNNSGSAVDSRTATVYGGGGTANNLQVSKSVRNQTLGQSYYGNSIEAQGLDVLEFEIRVRNVDSTYGTVTVRDVLPTELYYVPNSTTVGGNQVADGITSGGVTLGQLAPNEERVIRFRATVFSGTSNRFITNQANATMNSGVQNAFASIQIRNRGQVLGAADVVTGPEDVVPWVLFLGFIGSIGSYVAIFKYRLVEVDGGEPQGPVSELQSLVMTLRSKEKKPDTEKKKA